MCTFITATMSPDGDEAEVRRLAKAQLLRWEEIAGSPVQSVLLPGERYFFTTRGMCDCDTAIGSARQSDWQVTTLSEERETKKLRKKGWGQHKIDRWLEEQRANMERRRRLAEERMRGRPAAVQNWVEFLHAATAEGVASHIGMIRHFYHGSVNSERIGLTSRVWISVSDLTNETLLQIEEDVLYVFARRVNVTQ